jgi:SlyX protein
MDRIEELSDRIDRLEAQQWHKIDALTRQLGLLDERLREAETKAPAPGNERPPHY